MKRILFLAALLLCTVAEGFTPIKWKWLSDSEIYFSNGKEHCTVQGPKWKIREAGPLKELSEKFPVEPEGAVNLTWSPDSTMLAFTRGNDLYVVNAETLQERQLTFDGSETIMNGYASWVYYEEIFGRPSRYRAFWWSPDSQKIAFYRFDDSRVPMFPIYSPFGQDGFLRETRYPKAGERNPEVRIGFIDLSTSRTTWADFDPTEDQYFGTPFWGSDSEKFFVSREPRIQNTLDLFAVSPVDGSKKHIYHESSKTWLDWIDGMLFAKDGIYMVRSFETSWQQIYFLSYDGSVLRRLTGGENWRVGLVRLGEDGSVYFTAQRDSRVRSTLYRLSPDGSISALTDPSLNVSRVLFSPNGRYFACSVSALDSPTRVLLYDLRKKAAKPFLFSEAERTEEGPEPGIFSISNDNHTLYATIAFPKDFDPQRKYPVHVDIYGGPDTPLVSDTWRPRYGCDRWFWEHGIIQVVADCRAAGHSGKRGLDEVYKHLNKLEVNDFVAFADYLKTLPYVDGEKIGVEGFSFGGTMTAMLLFTAPDSYHYGIAGGGVYDWRLYDTHYTERFMSTPEDNPDGYEDSCVQKHVSSYPVEAGKADGKVMLKITHGTGDDNVHFQNTLQLIDVLHREGKEFDFMIYPDGMHGYRGYQGEHFLKENRAFWEKYLLGKN